MTNHDAFDFDADAAEQEQPPKSPEFERLAPEEQTLPPHLKAVINYSLQRADEALERHVALLDLIRKHAVKATRPQDWIDFSGNGTSMMLDSAGAERLLSRIPVQWKLQLTSSVREDYPGEEIPFAYVVTGDVSVTIPGFPPIEIEGLQAGRGADAFFKKGAAQQGQPIDPLDVKASAESKWKRRAITIVLGLRGLTLADLAALAGEEFARQCMSVPRRQATGGSSERFPDAGTETDSQMKEATEAQQQVWRVLNALTKDRTKWPALVAYASEDRRAKAKVEDIGLKRYPPRRTVLGLTDKAAKFVGDKLAEINGENLEKILTSERS